MELNISTGRLSELLSLRLPSTLPDHQLSTIDAYRHAASMFFLSFHNLCDGFDRLSKTIDDPLEVASLVAPYALNGAWSVLENGYKCLRILEKPRGFRKYNLKKHPRFNDLLKQSYSLRNDSQHIDRDILSGSIFPAWGAICWGQVMIQGAGENFLNFYVLMPGSERWEYSPPVKTGTREITYFGPYNIFYASLFNRANKKGDYTNSIDLIELYNMIIFLTDDLTEKLLNVFAEHPEETSARLGLDIFAKISMEKPNSTREGFLRIALIPRK